MKKSVLTVFALLVWLATALGAAAPDTRSASIASEEYAIYAAILKPNEPDIPDDIKDDPLRKDLFLSLHRSHLDIPALGGSGPFYVLEMTSTRKLSRGKPQGKEDAKDKTDTSLIDDFNKKNEVSARLENRFPAGMQVSLIPEAAMREIFSLDGGGWEEFRKRYPLAGGTLSFSRVGFSADRTKAVVFVHSQADYEMGAGYYVDLEKAPRTGTWVITAAMLAFMS